VLVQAGADVRAVDDDIDDGGPRRVGGTDARELEELGRGDAAAREDHLAGVGAQATSLHAGRSAAVEQDAVHDGVRLDAEIGPVREGMRRRR
jgi:hypothetical protein